MSGRVARQSDREGRPFVRARADPDAATVSTHDVIDDEKPEPDAAVVRLVAPMAPLHRIEDDRQ